jgi:methylmalonyl-CoA/ethylmalonyl-CoA epimerase
MSAFRFRHLGLAVPDLDKATEVHGALFGWGLLSGPFEDPAQQAKVAFVGTGAPGDLVLELVAPADPASHVNRLLAKGAGAYHICCEVDDLDESLRALRSAGCLIVREPAPAVAFEGRRIAWFYTPTRQLMELVERGR